MSESSRRKSSSPKTATKKRLDQRSDPKKSHYKIRRKIPDPPELERGIHPASTSSTQNAPKISNGSPPRTPKRTKIRHPAARSPTRQNWSAGFIPLQLPQLKTPRKFPTARRRAR